MQFIFLISLIVLLISLPSVIIYILLIILSKTILKTLTFKQIGYLKYKDINFYIDNNFFFLGVHIDYFRIYLIWLRFRINPNGLKVTFTLKNHLSSSIKSSNINKKSSDSFVIQRNTNPEKKTGILYDIKEKFFNIIKEKYIENHLNKEEKKQLLQEEEYVDNLIKKTDISEKDKILRNILVFFDLLLQEFELNFKLSENDFFYCISLKKGVFGVVKGLNKHKEIHLMVLIYNLKVTEYINSKNIKFKKGENFNPFKIKNINNIENEHLKNSLYNFSNEYAEFNIIDIQKIFVNFKLEYGFYPISNLSINNTINLKVEIEHSYIKISSRAINTIMKLISEIIKFNIFLELKSNNEKKNFDILSQILESKEIKFKIECVEEILLNMISDEIKKIKIKLTDLNINLLSDNQNYNFSGIQISNIQFSKSNSFNYFYDNTKLKLLNSQSIIKLNDLIISSSKLDKIILEIENYSLNFNSEVIYYHQIREAQILSKFESVLPNSNIIISKKELDKYFEIIFNVLSSIDKMETYSSNNIFESKYREEPYEQNIINMNFDNVNIIIHDEIIQSELNNFSIKLLIDERKNKGCVFNIDFTPIYLNFFKKYSTLYSSNCIINGLKLSIIDDLKNSNIHIKFDDTLLLIYDDILMDIMKFMSSFLTFSHKYNLNKNVVIEKEKNKLNKDILFLDFPKIKLYYYVYFNDLFSLKINDFKFVIDDIISIPKMLIYHQNLDNVFLKKKTLILNLTKSNIRFNPEINEINIEFGPTNLNIYSFTLIYTIISIINYYQFFPEWIDFHMNYKYKNDEDYKIIVIDELEQKDKCNILLNEINININQSLISNCSIFQTNPENILNFPSKTYSYLDDIKCEQIQIKIKGFYLENENINQKDLNKDFNNDNNEDDSESLNELKLYVNEDNNRIIYQKTISYYNKITLFQNNNINFNLIDIYFENLNIIHIENLRIEVEDTLISDMFDVNQLNSVFFIYKTYSIFNKKIQSRKTKYENISVYTNNAKIFLNDIRIVDKIFLLVFDLLETRKKYPFQINEINNFGTEEKIQQYDKLYLYINNIQGIITCLDPKTNELYNKLYLNINYLGMTKENENDINKIQLSLYYLTFGFNFSKNNDYPLLILPILEVNINGDIIKVNLPSNCLRKIKNIDKTFRANNYIGNNKLDVFILNTQSFTIFINFPYLETFSKIIENLYKRCELIQKFNFNANNQISKEILNSENLSTIKDDYKTNILYRNTISQKKSNDIFLNDNNIINENINENKSIKSIISEKNKEQSNISSKKIIITVFDIKLIYLLNYKDNYDSTFAFHKEIKERGYFGYILRLYNASIKYTINLINEIQQYDELNANIYLFTISCLNEDNLIDEKFFRYDKDISNEKFMNLKITKNFYEFMEISIEKSFKYLLINNIFDSKKENKIFDYYYNDYSLYEDNFEELKFDFNNTLVKIYNINLKRDSSDEKKLEELNINLNEMKVTWNKLNMDMVNILIFEDILNIIDNILLKIYPIEEEKDEKDKISENTFDLGRFNFIFEINDFQVCIENELTYSKVLLATRSKCVFGIKKLCMNEKSKNFKMELIIKDLLLFIPPFSNQHIIYFIGNSSDNKYYLDDSSFNQMVNIPNISFSIKEQINNVKNKNNNNIEIFTYINIKIDKLIGDFSKEYFEAFMNIIKVFIFNRGDTYAEEKISIDSRNEDLIKFKIKEIKSKIIDKIKIKNTKKKIKQISFSLDKIIMTLKKEKKENIKLEMKKFEGEHIIYSDLSSETLINIYDINIFDLLNIKNKIILSLLNSKNLIDKKERNDNIYENKIEMLRFRRKDSNISIGTESKWYVLDYLEIGVEPLFINVTKYQCDFILEFFFNTNSNESELNEEDLKKKVIENKKVKENKSEKIEYPIYFKQVKINETKLNISYYFSEGSRWNLKEAKIKFSEFEKRDKFYPYSTLIYRFIHHLKIIGIQNVGNVLASVLFTFDNSTKENNKEKNKEEEDKNYKKLLFGNLNDDK